MEATNQTNEDNGTRPDESNGAGQPELAAFDWNTPVTGGEAAITGQLQRTFNALGHQLLDLPESRERSLAFTTLEESFSWARKAVTYN